ncbi:MAG: DUF1566 domain-containing protein [bacterium]|nr:DUF1566 domain-containing protein [bacterium]
MDNGDGTVTDRARGLMWQQGGSDKMPYDEALDYVRRLNKGGLFKEGGFAGRRDWRLPTLEEAASLLAPARQNNLYIDPVFEGRQQWIWTADETEQGSGAVWVVVFYDGHVYWDTRGRHNAVRACRAEGQ